MRHVGKGLQEFFSLAGPDVQRLIRLNANNANVARAVRLAWADNPLAARFLLEHINAFYILEDKTPRRGPEACKAWMVSEFLLNDSMAKAELNARREILHSALEQYGINVKEVRIKTSYGAMRSKQPFLKYLEAGGSVSCTQTVAAVGAHASANPFERELTAKEKLDVLESFKRACCLVYGADAADVLALINAVQVKEAVPKNESLETYGSFLTRRPRYYLNLFGDKGRLETAILSQSESIVAHCRDLGLYVAAISARDAAPEMRSRRAFPSNAAPLV